ncbi:MAG TPA: acetyl ornithine aminotransferase family protein [Nitrospiria bacterium]|nr:acetyl ornithine aminotransferase family protein [Nitrospiria bacterium]
MKKEGRNPPGSQEIMMKPAVRKEAIPGARALEWVARDEKIISKSYTRTYPLVAESGRGARVTDVDGHEYLDFTSGLGTSLTGHCHPEIVKAIVDQAQKLIHMSGTDFYYASQIRLAEEIGSMMPGLAPQRVFFSNSGAEANEAAIKLARYAAKRPQFIAFQGAFHGRTMGALSLTGSKTVQKKSFFPMMPGVTHVPYPNCYRCPINQTYPSCGVACVDTIREVLKTTLPPDEVAAIFVEPVQGEGGYVVPPPDFFKKLKSLADEFGILIVADEVQSGSGRTGKFLAIEHFGVVPDIVTLAKGIASGMPLGITVSRDSLMTWGPGSHASTFGGHPISCEAALKTLQLLREGLMENAARVGSYILKKLQEMKLKHRLIGDVRGLGLMIGIELVKDRETKERAVDERNEVVQTCFKKGFLIVGCGQNTVRFLPPVIITEKDADRALSLFEEALTEIEQRRFPVKKIV